jgi:hypothetical protein
MKYWSMGVRNHFIRGLGGAGGGRKKVLLRNLSLRAALSTLLLDLTLVRIAEEKASLMREALIHTHSHTQIP